MRKLTATILVATSTALFASNDAVAAFRTYPILWCGALGSGADTWYLQDDGQFDVPAGDGTLETICPVFNDDNFNVRTASGLALSFNGWQNAANQLGDVVCVTWAGGGGGYCGSEAQSSGTGVVHVTAQDLSAFGSTHSTSPSDTFYLFLYLGSSPYPGTSSSSSWSYTFTSN